MDRCLLDVALDLMRERLDALMDVQSYAMTPRASRAELLWQRWQAVLARTEVQQSIRAVGTIETYPVRAHGF